MPHQIAVSIGPASASPVGSVVWLTSGGLRATGFTGSAKTSGASSARLAASASPAMTSPTYSAQVTPDAQGMVKATVSGLTPGTQYWYAWELGGGLDTATLGRAKTPAAGPQSFTIVFASCDNGSGTSAAYSRMLTRNPLIFLSPGDLHYGDVTTNNAALYRAQYDTLFSSVGGGPFFEQVPYEHTPSDHDFADNNSIGTSGNGLTVKTAFHTAFRQCEPHHLLPVTDGVYRTFVLGRVRFLITDNRSYKSLQTNTDNSSKTVLGTTQKQWFKDVISSATEPVILWLNDQPWTNMGGADDEWANYNTERQELGTFISGSGKNVMILAGDMHAVAADDGTNSPGTIPVVHASPLENSASIKGTYTSGPFPASGSATVEQYGVVAVTDSGGASISVQFNGYDGTDTSRASLLKTYSGLTAGPSPTGPGGTWTLVFADEFTGSAVSTSNWRSGSLPWGDLWISSNSNEREWYDAAAATVSSGTAKLTATAQTHGTFTTQTYRSGMIHSQKRFHFVYGFAEARMKLPTALGVWPAFWMAPSDESWPPEIDIMEAYGSDPAAVYASNFHYDIGGGATNVGAQDHTLASTRTDWHVYGMRWTPTAITFWADGTLVRTVTTGVAGARNVPMYLLLNLAVSDSQGGLSSGDYPQVVEIDYVRVWEG